MDAKKFFRAERRSTFPSQLRLRAPARDAGAALPQAPASTISVSRAIGSPRWTSTLEAWPAAGGGVLVGIAIRALSGDAMLRSAIKTTFLRIDAAGVSTLIVPYVALVPEAAAGAVAMVAAELGAAVQRVGVEHCGSSDAARRTPRRLWIEDLGAESRRGLAFLAATAQALLIAAAAERWRIGVAACRAAGGLIVDEAGLRSLTFAQIAADAALQELPAVVRLRSGVQFELRRRRQENAQFTTRGDPYGVRYDG
jgi:hypothetical protein